MTIVVFAGGEMASDSLVAAGGTRHGGMRKLARSRFGNVAGGCGCCAAVHRFLQQVEEGRVDGFDLDPTEASFTGLVATADGDLYRVSSSGVAFPLIAGFAAIGTGADIALGALHMGATAQQAVEAAIAYETSCGGAVQIERLDNGAIRPATGERGKAP